MSDYSGNGSCGGKLESIASIEEPQLISEGKFAEIAEVAKSGCPASKVLSARTSLVEKFG